MGVMKKSRITPGPGQYYPESYKANTPHFTMSARPAALKPEPRQDPTSYEVMDSFLRINKATLSVMRPRSAPQAFDFKTSRFPLSESLLDL